MQLMTCANCNRPVCAERLDEACQAFGALYRLWMHFQLVYRDYVSDKARYNIDAIVEAECILELAGSIS